MTDPLSNDLDVSNYKITGTNIVMGDDSNYVFAHSGASNISGGRQNQIDLATYDSNISGGYGNYIANSTWSNISGGKNNTIKQFAYGCAIGGGSGNYLYNGFYNTIGGGQNNKISGGLYNCTIGGGYNNYIKYRTSSSKHNTIIGGWGNYIYANTYNTVLGGRYNQLIGNITTTMVGGTGNTVTASSSFILGANNTCAGSSSAVFGVYNECLGDGDTALVFGQYASCDKWGSLTQAGGRFSTRGDAQRVQAVCFDSITHSDTSWHQLYLDGSSRKLTIGSDKAWVIDAKIIGSTSGMAEVMGYHLQGVVENDGGTEAILYQNVSTLYEDDSNYDVQLATATNEIKLEVSDSAGGGATVRWVASVDITEVGF